MTETQTVEQTPAQTEPTRNVPSREEIGDLRELILKQAETTLANYQAVHSRLESQTNFEKALPDLRRSSDDPEVKALQAKVEKAESAILEWQRLQDAILAKQQTVLSDEDRTALETERDKVKKALIASVTFFATTSEQYGDDARVTDYVPAIGDVVKTRNSSSAAKSSGDGSGTRRLRVKNIYVQQNTNPDADAWAPAGTAEKSTFTNLVQWLEKNANVKVQTSDLHSAYFASAKTEDLDKIPGTHDFAYSVNGTTYWIRVVKNDD